MRANEGTNAIFGNQRGGTGDCLRHEVLEGSAYTRILTPKPDWFINSAGQAVVCNYAYNGISGGTGTEIRFANIHGLTDQNYLKGRVYVDGQRVWSNPGTDRGWDHLRGMVSDFRYGPPPGRHTLVTCTAGYGTDADGMTPWAGFPNLANNVDTFHHQGEGDYVREYQNPTTGDRIYSRQNVASFINLWFPTGRTFGTVWASGGNGRTPIIETQTVTDPGNPDPVAYFNSIRHSYRIGGSGTGVVGWIYLGPGEPNTANFGDPNDRYSCKAIGFQINIGPNVTGLSPTSGTQYNHNFCGGLISATVTDPANPFNIPQPSAKVNAIFRVTHGGTTVEARSRNAKVNGSSFNSNEVFLNGGQGQSLTQYIINNIPDGTNVSVSVQGEDSLGASDMDDLGRFFAAVMGGPVMTDDYVAGSTGQQNIAAPFRRGPVAATSFYKRTAPNPVSTKVYTDTNGTTLTNGIPNGSTFRSQVTITNTGQTPARNYDIEDHLGSFRDFERPTDVHFYLNGNEVSPGVVIEPVNSSGSVFSESDTRYNQDPRSRWRIRHSNDISAELAQGQSVMIRYTTRANRNRTANNPQPNNNADYSRAGPNAAVIPNAADTNVTYQRDSYCLSNRDTDQLDNGIMQAIAPWFRGQRGDIHSNAGASAYEPSAGGKNATYLVTANGSLTDYFNNGANPAPIEGYMGAATQCLGKTGYGAGQLDWRLEMVRNMNDLIADTGRQAGRTAPVNGDLNNNGRNVFYTQGSTTIGALSDLHGVGTIFVNGDLRITGDWTYDDAATTIASLGVIVRGNLTIDPGVQNLAGSFYVSDWTGAFDGICPVVDMVTLGSISTGASNVRLNVSGLMVASKFNLQRYAINVTANAANPDPSEDVYYDGRVLTATPPGFGTFNSAQWYEIAP